MKNTCGIILCGASKFGVQMMTHSRLPLIIDIKDGYSILDKQVFQYKCAGMDRVCVIAETYVDELEDYVKKYSDITVEVMKDVSDGGSVGALQYALDTIDGDIVLRNGDVVSDINLTKFITEARDSHRPITVNITRMPSQYGVVKIKGDIIVGFDEKPIIDTKINAGIYYFKKDIDVPKPYSKGRIESTLFPEYAKNRLMSYYEEDVFWRSLKTSVDYSIIRKEYEDKKDKAWGYEKLLVHTDKYMTKELFIRDGFRTSFHQHDAKDETMYIGSGRGYVEFSDSVEYFSQGDKVRIEPRTPHSIVALENTILYEFSTPHLDDTIRIEDYYPRDTE